MSKSKIKNWTVVAESIKNKSTGLIKYIRYLNSTKELSHEKTTIHSIFKNDQKQQMKFIKTCCGEALSLDLENSSKKGGRPVDSYAVSFDLTLPHSVENPTIDQWKLIAKDIYKTIKDNIDEDLTEDHIYMNIHDQENPHLNIVVSKVIGGKRSRKLDQYSLLSKIKAQYNLSTLKHCDLNFEDYEPLNTKLGRRKKKWQLEVEKMNKLFNQMESLVKYSNENNQKRIASTKNRIIKTLDGVSSKIENEFFETVEQFIDKKLKDIVEEIKLERKKRNISSDSKP